ncbi:hypothetical protein BROUX41_001125 [Berkeleyomyces rouxiae]|uniref:uncharacterized protein n=1 Tax=Berkeleyomyces rouxiae TaxID=2035830 RepID=UPI003B7E65F8
MSSVQSVAHPHHTAHASAPAPASTRAPPSHPALSSQQTQQAPPPAAAGSARASLPNRAVSADTIEDAFVSFILYCNPAVPAESDVSALREAFCTLPKSDGKAFSPFRLYELIRQLDSREVKTWVELALGLGVEPPDHAKGQSTQKIQQYAVRLKRWMHSLHVDAFFEYLIGREHIYWVQIPTDPNPVGTQTRDGVPPEDDMALRALLPHIRPRRGRKRADETEHQIGSPSPLRREYHEPYVAHPAAEPDRSPHQRYQDPPPHHQYQHYPDQPQPWPWPPLQHARQANPASSPNDHLRPSKPPLGGTSWQRPGSTPVPNHAHAHADPQANTPSAARPAVWPDDPRATPAPPSTQKLKKRYGAKAVSSAWRSTSRGKTRGRPPANRTPADDAPALAPAVHVIKMAPRAPAAPQPQLHADPHARLSATDPAPYLPPLLPHQLRPPKLDAGRLATPPAHEVAAGHALAGYGAPPTYRLATPVATPAIHGSEAGQRSPAEAGEASTPEDETNTSDDEDEGGEHYGSGGGGAAAAHQPRDNFPTNIFPPTRTDEGDLSFPSVRPTASSASSSHAQKPAAGAEPFPNPYSHGQTDATNLDDVYNFLLMCALTADWVDANGQPTHPADVPEARGIVDTTFVDLHRKAKTKEAFLINVAVLAGGKILLHKRPRFQRADITPEYTRYVLAWEYRLGATTVSFTNRATVYKNGEVAAAAAATDEQESNRHFANGDKPPDSPEQSSEYWKRKYTDLLKAANKREDMRDRVATAVMVKDSDVNPYQTSWKEDQTTG